MTTTQEKKSNNKNCGNRKTTIHKSRTIVLYFLFAPITEPIYIQQFAYMFHTHTREKYACAHTFFVFIVISKGAASKTRYLTFCSNAILDVLLCHFFCCCKFFGRLFLTCYMYFVLLFSLDVGLYTYNYKEKLDLLLAIRCLYCTLVQWLTTFIIHVIKKANPLFYFSLST